MSTRNWDRVAQNEFDNMDPDEQASFADLRERVERGTNSKWHISNIWGN